MARASRKPGSISGVSRSAKVRSLIAWAAPEGSTCATCCMSHLFLSPARRFVAARPPWPRWLADFFFLHQAQVPADVEAEVPRKKACDALDVERAVCEICAGVRRTLDDPDLAWSAIRVVEAAAVIDGGDVVGAAMNEEQRPRLQRAQHVAGAALRDSVPRAHEKHHARTPHEGRT